MSAEEDLDVFVSMLPPSFLALTVVRTLAGLASSLVFIIQLKLPNKNQFVAGLALTIALFNFLRVVYTLYYDTTAQLQSDRLSCWTNFVIGVYLNNAEHLMALGVTVELWCMVRHSMALERNERKAMFLTLLFPFALCTAMVFGIYSEQSSGSVLDKGAIALRVDKCFMQRPAWAAWVGILGINFSTSILILILSVHTIIRIIGTVRKNSHVLHSHGNSVEEPHPDAEIDLAYVQSNVGRKYSNASQVIPPKFYARIFVLLVFCLVYSLISTVTIAIKLHSNPLDEPNTSPAVAMEAEPSFSSKAAYIISPSQPSKDQVDKDHFVECADFLGAADGLIVFFIFGSSSEAIRHFWSPLRQSCEAFCEGMVTGSLKLYQALLVLLCCGRCSRMPSVKRTEVKSPKNEGEMQGLLMQQYSNTSEKAHYLRQSNTFGRKYSSVPNAIAPGVYPPREDSAFSQGFKIPSNGESILAVTNLDVPSFVDVSKAPYLLGTVTKKSAHDRKFSHSYREEDALNVLQSRKTSRAQVYNRLDPVESEYAFNNSGAVSPASQGTQSLEKTFQTYQYPSHGLSTVERDGAAEASRNALASNTSCFNKHFPETLELLDDSETEVMLDPELSQIHFEKSPEC